MHGMTFVPRLLHSLAFRYPHRKKISAFSVFFLVYKHYVMLQFQLSRLCRLEIALQTAPSCSSWATSEKTSIFVHSSLCTVLSWLNVFLLMMNWFLGPAFAWAGWRCLSSFVSCDTSEFPLWAEKILKAWILCLSETSALILNFQSIFSLILRISIKKYLGSGSIVIPIKNS